MKAGGGNESPDAKAMGMFWGQNSFKSNKSMLVPLCYQRRPVKFKGPFLRYVLHIFNSFLMISVPAGGSSGPGRRQWADTRWLGNTQPSLFCLLSAYPTLSCTLSGPWLWSAPNHLAANQNAWQVERECMGRYGLESALPYSDTNSSHFTCQAIHISTPTPYFALKTSFSVLVKHYRLIVSW